MKRIPSMVIAGIVAGVFAFTGLLPASAAPRTQALHITKNCIDYHGAAGEFCTITTSNLRAIKPGSRVIYKSAAGTTSLDTDIVLRTGHGNRAFGHVVLDLPLGPGRSGSTAEPAGSGTSTPQRLSPTRAGSTGPGKGRTTSAATTERTTQTALSLG